MALERFDPIQVSFIFDIPSGILPSWQSGAQDLDFKEDTALAIY